MKTAGLGIFMINFEKITTTKSILTRTLFLYISHIGLLHTKKFVRLTFNTWKSVHCTSYFEVIKGFANAVK